MLDPHLLHGDRAVMLAWQMELLRLELLRLALLRLALLLGTTDGGW